MAYEYTNVAPEKSQASIRKLLMSHGAINVSFASGTEPPQEGFMATVTLDTQPYVMKIVVPMHSQHDRPKVQDQETRRVWRVLFHHMKAVFEAADSGVIDIRELLLPFLVTRDGRTVGQAILKDLQKTLEAPKRAFLE